MPKSDTPSQMQQWEEEKNRSLLGNTMPDRRDDSNDGTRRDADEDRSADRDEE